MKPNTIGEELLVNPYAANNEIKVSVQLVREDDIREAAINLFWTLAQAMLTSGVNPDRAWLSLSFRPIVEATGASASSAEAAPASR